MMTRDQVQAAQQAAQRDEYEVLKLVNQYEKLVLAVTYPLTPRQRQALERLQVRGWVILIDIVRIDNELTRIFSCSPSARVWMRTYERNQWMGLGGGQ